MDAPAVDSCEEERVMDGIKILEAVESLRDEWTDLFEEEDARALAAWLEATPRDDPEAVRQTVNRVLDLLQRYPEAKARVSGELGIQGPLESAVRGLYEPLPGEQGEIPAGALMVCPEDPSHYRRRLRQKGQRFYCPQHRVDLVPADSIGRTLRPAEE
jgi:hypothetical protein